MGTGEGERGYGLKYRKGREGEAKGTCAHRCTNDFSELSEAKGRCWGALKGFSSIGSKLNSYCISLLQCK